MARDTYYPVAKPITVVVTGWAILGLSMIVEPFVAWAAYPVFVTGQVLSVIIGALLTVGSSLLALSTKTFKNVSTSWKMEMLALPMLIGVWFSEFFLILASPVGHGFIPGLVILSFGIACLVRLFESSKHIKQVRSNVKSLSARLK